MANFEYKNIDEIISDNLPKRGVTIPLQDLSLLEKRSIVPDFDPTYIDPITNKPSANVEIHTFLKNLGYIKSGYGIDTYSVDSSTEIPTIKLQIHKDLENLNVPPTEYKVVYNFLKDIIGSYDSKEKLFISDISDDRTEIKLSLVTPESTTGRLELARFVLENVKPKTFLPPIVLNFGENKLVDVINVTSDGDPFSFYVKLYEPLSPDLDIFFTCWVSIRTMKPYIDTVNLVPEQFESEVPFIQGPNFEVDYDYWITSDSEYKSWTEILGENVHTSEQLMNRYISGSNLPVTLNVDYTEFKNFIYYSNARSRVENFLYKMELIEFYKSEISRISTITGSVETNKVKIQLLKDKVISGFDGFEKYLYYNSTGSYNYTYQLSASISPYPKYELNVTSSYYDIGTREGKFNFYSYSSSYVEDWSDNLLSLADDHDSKNYYALARALPDHIREDSDNDQAVTFVNMLGQHFDIMYLYTDHILKKNLREQHPKEGLSQDLIFDATKNFGWTLSHGSQAKDLWEYALGLSGSGEPIWTGKTTTNKYLAKTYEERTKEVWRRIFNNLPYIYKTKGTARGIKALLSAYGIPETLLTIREYGGPDNADLGIIPRNEWEKQTYYFNFFGSLPLPTTNRYIYVPWERVNNATGSWQYPDTVTFRWKMEPESSYKYTSNLKQTLLQKQSGSRVDWFVTMDKNAGTDEGKGTITFWLGNGSTYTSASIYDDYFYDDVPLNLMISREYSNDATSSNQIYRFFVKTAKYGKLVIERSGSIVVSGSSSGSYNRAWSSDGTLYIGSGSNSQTTNILSGSVFELRYWSNQLNESSFNNHVLAPRSYNGNTATSSFYDLQGQWKFWQKFDVADTSSLMSSHPNQTKSTFYSSSKHATFYNFTSESFESIRETYNMEVATVGNNTPFSEKVRIDSGSLIGGLDPLLSSEVSQFDKFSVDSNKLMVAFSPQSIINEDIYEAIGYTTIDDYFGEYSNINKDEYPRLKWFAREYWQKYPNKNDFTAYINLLAEYDFSVFDQIRQTLPARVNEILGLVIEPNILERSKVKVLRNFSGESPEKSVRRTNEISSSALPTVSISSKKATILIGFENESSYQEVEGETDIPLEIEATQDINVGGDYDTKIVGIGYAKKYQMNISSSHGHFGNFVRNYYKPYNAIILIDTGSFESKYTKYYTSIQHSQFGKVFASIASGVGTGLTSVYGTLDTAFSNTFERQNIQYSEGTPNTGYGLGWTTVANDGGKSSALFTTYQSYRTDSYYSAYKFYYTSSADMAERNYSSYQFVSASYENPNNLTNSIRNHRFEGCKLTGPDINIDTRNTPDGKPVVEVFIVDSNQINTNQNFTTSGI
jgi:hypothetical protein